MSEEEKKPAKKVAELKVNQPKIVVFESREQEPGMFDVAGYHSIRDQSGKRLEWHVPADDAERFSSHFFCQTGRVVRKNDGSK